MVAWRPIPSTQTGSGQVGSMSCVTSSPQTPSHPVSIPSLAASPWGAPDFEEEETQAGQQSGANADVEVDLVVLCVQAPDVPKWSKWMEKWKSVGKSNKLSSNTNSFLSQATGRKKVCTHYTQFRSENLRYNFVKLQFNRCIAKIVNQEFIFVVVTQNY